VQVRYVEEAATAHVHGWLAHRLFLLILYPCCVQVRSVEEAATAHAVGDPPSRTLSLFVQVRAFEEAHSAHARG
jgi:hypothetical protein